MINLLQKINPEWVLRLALGFVYLYSGFNLFNDPTPWLGFIPEWFQNFWSGFASLELYLRIQGIGEIVLALFFLAWFSNKLSVRIASALAALEMILILLLVGVDLITFRDIGVLGAALSLFILSFKSEKGLSNSVSAS